MMSSVKSSPYSVIVSGRPVSAANYTDHHDIIELFFESGVNHHKTITLVIGCSVDMNRKPKRYIELFVVLYKYR